MKNAKRSVTVFALLAFNFVSAQNRIEIQKESQDEPEKYYFQTFTSSIVYLKNGSHVEAKANYQMPDKAIAYKDDNDKTLFLSNPGDVDSVVINGFTYIPIQGKFYEKLDEINNMMLLTNPMGKYETEGKENIGNSSNNLSNAYVLRVQKQNMKVRYSFQYWISTDGKSIKKLNSIKSFEKLFPTKKSEFESYISTHKVDEDKINSVLDMVNALR